MPSSHPNDVGVRSGNELALNFSVQYSAIIVFLINTSCTLLQVKYQTTEVTPFDTHYVIMLAFFVIVYLHALLLVREIKSQTHNSSNRAILGKISPLAGALASILPLLILVPPFGWFTLFLWAIYFAKVAHNTLQDFFQLLYHATLEVLNLLNRTLMNQNRRLLEHQNQLPV